MKRKKLVLLTVAVTTVILGLPHAFAHDFFVSVIESMSHPPGHISVFPGWGHSFPMDDYLAGDILEAYTVYDPDLRKTDIPFDRTANKDIENNPGKEIPDFPAATIKAGDAFIRQLFFKKDAPQGTYQVALIKKKTQYNSYIDKKGRKRWNRRPLDQIKDAKKINTSINYQSFAKAFATIGKWTKPKPLGHELELVPLTDLSQVNVGDLVSFKVLLRGEPVERSDPSHGVSDLTAYGSQYGGPGYGLRGKIYKGVAKIQVTAPGEWMVAANIYTPVTQDSGPKELVGKCLDVGLSASVTFHVQ